jgi:hypothetical protein
MNVSKLNYFHFNWMRIMVQWRQDFVRFQGNRIFFEQLNDSSFLYREVAASLFVSFTKLGLYVDGKLKTFVPNSPMNDIAA